MGTCVLRGILRGKVFRLIRLMSSLLDIRHQDRKMTESDSSILGNLDKKMLRTLLHTDVRRGFLRPRLHVTFPSIILMPHFSTNIPSTDDIR